MSLPAVNYLAVLVAGIVIFPLGGLWQLPVLFAKRWMALMGKPEAQLRAGAAGALVALVPEEGYRSLPTAPTSTTAEGATQRRTCP